MNFLTVPTIPQAIIERAKHPGLVLLHRRLLQLHHRLAVHAQRVTGLTREAIGYENGVLGGVISALTAFAAPGDGVLLHSPTYIGFTRASKTTATASSTVRSRWTSAAYGAWITRIWTGSSKEHHIHVAVFCSPHNPCGRVWERWEIEQAMEVYRRNDCLVISDEIWSDLTLGNHQHIPTQSVSEDARNRTVARSTRPARPSISPDWSGSYHIIYNHTPGPHWPKKLEMPLQRHERAFHARADRRLPARRP